MRPQSLLVFGLLVWNGVCLPSSEPVPPFSTAFAEEAPQNVRVLPSTFGASLPTPRMLALPPLRDAELLEPPLAGLMPQGVHRALPGDLALHGDWNALPSGREVWRLAIRSPGAASLRVHFEDFDVGPGKVWILDPETSEGRQVLGPYTGRGVFEDGEFWSGTVFGDSLVVEYHPEDRPMRRELPFRITEISHRWDYGSGGSALAASELAFAPGLRMYDFFSPLFIHGAGGPRFVLSCHEDVTCYPTWADAASGVGLIYWEDWRYAYECSGALLNTRGNSLKPYFLTANHCVTGIAAARSVEVFWNYRTSTCGGSRPPRSNARRTLGARYLTGQPASGGDFSLLLLSGDPPPGVRFLGWDPQEIDKTADVVTVHHPGGDYMRISFGQRVQDQEYPGRPAGKYYRVRYWRGRTEPGSSGAPLFARDGYVAGVLSLGPSLPPELACSYEPFENAFGRFAAAYEILKEYLEDTPALITSPPEGSTLSSSTVMFRWKEVPGATRYQLSVRVAREQSDLLNQDLGTMTLATVQGLPTDGRIINVRLSVLVDNVWKRGDYWYVSCNRCRDRADIVSPPSWAPLASPTVMFQWTPAPGATQYYLSIGSNPGVADLYNQDQNLRTSATVSGLPTDGRKIYVRLYTRFGSSWVHNDYVYITCRDCGNKTEIISPAHGTALTSSVVTFQWTPASAEARYYLAIGSDKGLADLYNQDQGKRLSVTLTNLPDDGRTLHVRLSSSVDGRWVFSDVVYFTCRGCGSRAEMISPPDLSVLTSPTITFKWTEARGATQYYLSIGSKPGVADLYNEDQGLRTSVTVGGLPTDGRVIYARLYTRFDGTWVHNDYTYGTCTDCINRARIVSPAPGSQFSSSTVIFEWSAIPGAHQYHLDIGSAPGAADLYNEDEGLRTSVTVRGLPTDGREIWVRLSTRFAHGWEYEDHVYQAAMGPGDAPLGAELIKPAPNSQLASSTVTFEWSVAEGAEQYYLGIGSGRGAADLYNQDQGLRTSVTVSGLPTDGRTIWVRLSTRFGVRWVYNDYSFTAFSEGLRIRDLTLWAALDPARISGSFKFSGAAGRLVFDPSASGARARIEFEYRGALGDSCSFDASGPFLNKPQEDSGSVNFDIYPSRGVARWTLLPSAVFVTLVDSANNRSNTLKTDVNLFICPLP